MKLLHTEITTYAAGTDLLKDTSTQPFRSIPAINKECRMAGASIKDNSILSFEKILT